MGPASSDGAMRLQAIPGDTFRVLKFEDSTHASAEAAAAVGCDVAQIARSMLFRAADGRPVVVLAAGANRVDEKKVASLPAMELKRANAAFVRLPTGTAPGGVAPVRHPTAPIAILDRDLKGFVTICASGGPPNAKQFSFQCSRPRSRSSSGRAKAHHDDWGHNHRFAKMRTAAQSGVRLNTGRFGEAAPDGVPGCGYSELVWCGNPVISACTRRDRCRQATFSLVQRL